MTGYLHIFKVNIFLYRSLGTGIYASGIFVVVKVDGKSNRSVFFNKNILEDNIAAAAVVAYFVLHVYPADAVMCLGTGSVGRWCEGGEKIAV